MLRLRRIGVVKTATFVSVYLFVITLVFLAPIWLLVALFGAGSSDPDTADMASFGLVGAILGTLVAAALYAVFGWVTVAISCAIYNWLAGPMGGIEIRLETVAPPPVPGWGAPTGQPASGYPPAGPPPGWPPAGTPPSAG